MTEVLSPSREAAIAYLASYLQAQYHERELKAAKKRMLELSETFQEACSEEAISSVTLRDAVVYLRVDNWPKVASGKKDEAIALFEREKPGLLKKPQLNNSKLRSFNLAGRFPGGVVRNNDGEELITFPDVFTTCVRGLGE